MNLLIPYSFYPFIPYPLFVDPLPLSPDPTPCPLSLNLRKEPDAFGQSGDEIAVRLFIPMGHYKAGAKKFQAWVNM